MKVSIVIPIYNVEEYVIRCLDSVANQTYHNIECVLVNDCTPDNSMLLVEDYLTNYKGAVSFVVCDHQVNRGLSVARNTGIKASKGELIFFLDSDDKLYPYSIESLVNLYKIYPNIDFAIGTVNVDGSQVNYSLKCGEFIEGQSVFNNFALGKWYVMAWNKLFRRSYLVENNLWFEDGLLHEDELFSFYTAVTAKSIACSLTPSYLYRIRNEGSIMSCIGMKNFQSKIIINKAYINYFNNNIARFSTDKVSSFLVNSTFALVVALVRSSKIRNDQKKQLLCKLLFQFRSVKKTTKSNSYNIRIKRLILLGPVFFVQLIVKILNSLNLLS